MEINNIIGIDLAKNIFQAHKATKSGRKIWSKKLSRKELLELMAKETRSIVAMEACAGAHYFAEKFREMGHEVRLIAPKFVKPYVKNNKNDAADAEAICEASCRENMRFVPVKTEEQRILCQVHKARAMQVANRTALSNEIRGFLLEFGVTIPVGRVKFVRNCNEALESRKFPGLFISNINRLLLELKHIEANIKLYDEEIFRYYNNSPEAKRLGTIPGIGEVTATAIMSVVPNVSCFKKGRDLSAYLGLVPRQFSSGGKTSLGGISKRGNSYLRTLLVQGAMAVIKHAKDKKTTSKRTLWIQGLLLRLGVRKTAVAIANKNARIVYAILKTPDAVYQD